MTEDAPQATITYFTDPLCSWSWAFESVRRQLVAEYGARVNWSYRMGGLLPHWDSFRDPINAVHTPAQLAPAWYAVARTTGATLDESIWREDPPLSSFPACIAVKAAAAQGAPAEEAYLVTVRAAVMTRRLNVARRAVLIQLARELAEQARFDAEQFARDLTGAGARERFASDLRDCRVHDIGRFPTFVVRGAHASRIVVGYRPLDVFKQVLAATGCS